MRTKDGGYRWFFDQGRAIRDGDGRPVRMVGSMHDVTERVEAEAVRTRLGRIVENSLNEIFVFDSETLQFLEVNAGAQANLQYSTEELHSTEELRRLTPLDLKPDFTQESFETLVEPLRSGMQDRVRFETVHRRKDGSTYPVAVRLQLMAQESPPVFVAFIEDITERLDAEAMRSRLGRIIENSLNEIYVIDAESLHFVEVNAGALRNLQYRADEIREMTPLDFVLDYTLDELRALLASVRDGETPSKTLQARHRRKDGSIYDVAVHLQYMGEERPPVYVAFVEDVSERNQADEELREVYERLSASEELFRSMTENQPGAVYRSRPDEPWRDVYFSDGIEELSGYPASDFVDHAVRRFADIVHRDDVGTYYDSTITKEPNTEEYRIIHRDGSVRWIQDRNRGVYDGDEVRWIDGILIDVTAQKELAAALASSEDQFRTMVANMPGAAYRSLPDEHWTNVYLSDRIEEITGYPAEDFIDAKARRIVDIVHSADREIFLHSTVSGESRPEEYRIIHRDGSIRWIQDSYRGLHDAQGNLLWVDGVMFDVTARKEAEAALAASENQFRTMVDNMPGAIYRRLPDEYRTDVYLSDAIEPLTGYSAGELLRPGGRKFEEIIHPDDLEDYMNAGIDPADDPFIMEYRIVRADGTIRWLHDRSRIIDDKSGNAQWVDGVLLDVTARHEAEDAFAAASQEREESEAQFRLMVANVPGAIYRCRAVDEWPMHHMSEGIEELTGYPASDFIGNRVRSFSSIIVDDDLQPIDEVLERIRSRAQLENEYRIIRADGSERWVYERSQGVFDARGELEWLDGAIVDIMARKEAEATARATQEQFSGIVSNLPGAVYRTKPDGWSMAFISERIRDLTGRAPAFFLDRGPEAFRMVTHPDDLEAVEAGIARIIETGASYDNEHRFCHTDGSVVWVHETARAVRGPDGRFKCLDGVIFDVTARKEAEAAARESQELFAGMVGNIPGAIYRTGSDGWTLEFVSEPIRDLT